MSDPIRRRDLLKTAACGFGHLALAGLAAEQAAAESVATRWPRGRRTSRPGPSGSSSCSCRGGSARSIRSTTSRVSNGRRQDAGLRRRPRPRQHRDAGLVAAGDEAALEVRAARRVRPLGLRPLPGDQPARRRPLLHPLDAHRGRGARPGDALPPLRVDEHGPAVDGLVGPVRPGDREREPPRLRLDRDRRRATAGRGTTATRSSPRSTRGRRWARPAARPRRPPSATWPTPALARGAARSQFDLLRALNAEQLRREPGRLRARGGHLLVRAGLADAGQRPDVLDLSREIPKTHSGPLRHRRAGDRQLRPAVPAGPAALRGGRPVRAGDLRRQHGQPRLGPAFEPAQARRPRPRRRPADRRAPDRPEAPRPARRHARLVGERVRPHALRREERHRPRPQPRRLHRLARRRRRQARLRLRRHRRASATRPCRTRSTCTTSTPPSCTCSASTTSG